MLQWQCILCVSKISIYIYLNEGITEFYSRIMKCCIVLLFGLKLHFSELSFRIFFCIFVAVAVWVKELGVWGLGSGVRIRTQASVECVPGVALDGSPLGCESPANVPIIIMAQSRGRCRAGGIITQNPEPRAQGPNPKQKQKHSQLDIKWHVKLYSLPALAPGNIFHFRTQPGHY